MAKSRYAIPLENINANAPNKGFKLVTDGVVSVSINAINVADPFKSLFPIREEVLGAITESMQNTGFDPSQPLIIWKQGNVLLDGHTRLQAAKNTNIAKIPVVFASFGSEGDALEYMYRLQFHRRNIKDSELITLAKNALEKYEKKYGEGGKAEFLSKRFTGLSVGKAKKLIAVIDNASEAEIIDIVNENLTINAIYESLNLVRTNHFEKKKNKSKNVTCDKLPPENTDDETEEPKDKPEIVMNGYTIICRTKDIEFDVLTFFKNANDIKLFDAVFKVVKKHYGAEEKV